MTKKTTKKKTEHMGFVRLSSDLRKRLDRAAVVEERDRSTVLRRALIEYLDKYYPVDADATQRTSVDAKEATT